MSTDKSHGKNKKILARKLEFNLGVMEGQRRAIRKLEKEVSVLRERCERMEDELKSRGIHECADCDRWDDSGGECRICAEHLCYSCRGKECEFERCRQLHCQECFTRIQKGVCSVCFKDTSSCVDEVLPCKIHWCCCECWQEVLCCRSYCVACCKASTVALTIALRKSRFRAYVPKEIAKMIAQALWALRFQIVATLEEEESEEVDESSSSHSSD